MEALFDLLNVQTDATKTWLMFGALWVALIIVGTTIHKLVLIYYSKFANRTRTKWDEQLAVNLATPSRWLVITFATVAAIQLANVPLKNYAWVEVTLKGLIVFFLFWCLERLVYTFIRAGILLGSISTSSRSLVSIIIRVAIFTIAILMILDAAGIPITPLLASLGVGSLAVALALQDTLSNLFSGFYLLADKPFQAGDYIELEGGIQGYVTHVGWRSTHIRMMTNNIIVVPNSKVATSTLTNYDLNEAQSGLRIGCGVAYESDLDQVERVCIEVAKQLSETSKVGVRGFEPVVRFTEFGDSSINFNVILRVNKYDNHFELTSEFIKALHKRFNQEGIEIPFPQRVLTFKTPLEQVQRPMGEA